MSNEAIFDENGWCHDMSAVNTDGTPVMVAYEHYEWPEIIIYQRFDPEDAKEMDEDGYWMYAEELLADVTDAVQLNDFVAWRPVFPGPKLQS